MTKRVRCRRFTYSGLVSGLFYNLLQNRLVQVVSSFFSGYSIGKMARRRKYPLPSPLFTGIRDIFVRARSGSATRPNSIRDRSRCCSPDVIEVSQERLFSCRGKHRVSIFIALAGAYQDLVLSEVDIFDSQRQTFHES